MCVLGWSAAAAVARGLRPRAHSSATAPLEAESAFTHPRRRGFALARFVGGFGRAEGSPGSVASTTTACMRMPGVEPQDQVTLPGFEAQVQELAKKIVVTYSKTIEIPSVVITPSLDAESYFEDFDLDTSKLPAFAPVEKTILVKALREQGGPADELAVRPTSPRRPGPRRTSCARRGGLVQTRECLRDREAREALGLFCSCRTT